MTGPTRVMLEAEAVLIEHSRNSISGCRCGWGRSPAELGQSHTVHVVQKLREAGLLAERPKVES